MSARTPVPAALSTGPFRWQVGRQHVSERVLRGPSYERIMRGAHSHVPAADHGARIRAARLVLPPDAVLGGRSALWAWGAELADADEPVEVVLPPTRRVRTRAQVQVRGDLLRPGEVARTPWGLVTSAARTGFDLGRRGGLRNSVPLLDALARATTLSPDEIASVAQSHRGARHITRLPVALAEMDGRAESVRESLLRLLVVEAGFPRPTVQLEVRDRAGRFLARVDLGWPELRLALEYDGAHHDNPAQIALDRRRLNALHAAAGPRSWWTGTSCSTRRWSSG